jgi:acyl carrier protein
MAELEPRLAEEVAHALQMHGFSDRMLAPSVRLYEDMGYDSVEKAHVTTLLEQHFGLDEGTLLCNKGISTVGDLVLVLEKQGMTHATHLAGQVLVQASIVTDLPGVDLGRIRMEPLDWAEVFIVLEQTHGFEISDSDTDRLLAGSAEDLVSYIDEHLEAMHGAS